MLNSFPGGLIPECTHASPAKHSPVTVKVPSDSFIPPLVAGCLVILEGTGPEPCNTHVLLLPWRDAVDSVETGCNNAGSFEHTFTVSGKIRKHWTGCNNAGSVEHTFTVSGEMTRLQWTGCNNAGSFEHTFSVSGEYPLVCKHSVCLVSIHSCA